MKNLDQKEFKPYLLNRFMVVGWFCFRRFFFWGGGGGKNLHLGRYGAQRISEATDGHRRTTDG